MGSRCDLLRTLVAAGAAGTPPGAALSFVPQWRAMTDSDDHYEYAIAL